MKRPLILLAASAVLCAIATGMQAQSGGDYDLIWNTIDGGGTTVTTGDVYALGGTIGQADAGTSAGGSYAIEGGFWAWSGAAVALTPTGTAVNGTVTPTVGATPTATLAVGCAGDCNRDGGVSINDLILMVNIALGTASASACMFGDVNDDGTITITELIAAVNHALGGC